MSARRANLATRLIPVIGVSNQPGIWLGFSLHLWTPRGLTDMTADNHGARAKLMRKLTAQAWLRRRIAGGKLNHDVAKANAFYEYIRRFMAHGSSAVPRATPAGAHDAFPCLLVQRLVQVHRHRRAAPQGRVDGRFWSSTGTQFVRPAQSPACNSSRT